MWGAVPKCEYGVYLLGMINHFNVGKVRSGSVKQNIT